MKLFISENQTGRKILKKKSFALIIICESNFNEFGTSYGTDRQKTLVWKPPQKIGIAELINRILLERAHRILSNVGLWYRHDFWIEAISTAFYLVNHLHTHPLTSKFQKLVK